MSENRSTALPSGEKHFSDSTNALIASVEADRLAALDGHAEPTDDTPTIISRNGPRTGHEEPPGGLRGRKLAHFELIEPIGVGGMAAVIRARDTQLDRLVALKILPPDMAVDDENIQRFHQEARSAARLDHENVARVFFCGEDQRLHFIAFEFVEGDNLRTILERRGRLPVAEALHYILQVAAGLAHAAQRGVVHRDIKPSNIIITPTGRAKLVDMGLARSMERQENEGLTHSGVTLGTFDYMSPEQALEPRDADVRSDIYSLGCTLYHVLTGHPPVPEGSAAKKLQHHQHIKPRDPRELVPGLPDEVAVILDRMMAKKPQDRYQSPEQLVHHLLLAAHKLGSAPNIPEGMLSVEAALPPPPGGRPLLMAGVAAALVVLLIAAMQLFHRSSGATPTVTPPVVLRPDDPRDDRRPSPADGSSQPAPAQTKDKAPDKEVVPPTTIAPVVYDDSLTMPSLVDWLKSVPADTEKTIFLSRDLDVSMKQGDEWGLIVSGPKVTIQAKSPDHRPTIRFTHDGRTQGTDAWAAVRIDSPDVTVHGVRILVDGRASDVNMVGLGLHAPSRKPGAFIVDNCEFIQTRTGRDDKRLTSLEAVGGDATASKLTLNGCRFLSFQELENEHSRDNETLVNRQFSGDDAIRRDGPVKIKATDCAFGPHGVLFRLEGGKGGPAPSLSLEHCSVLASGASTVFDVRAGAVVDLSIQASLFSRPEGTSTDASAEGAVLVRQAGAEGVTYSDRDNRYHGLDAYWVVGDGYAAAMWTEFQTKAGKGSTLITVAPWKFDPLQPFKSYTFKDDRAEAHFAPAFQINEARPELRTANGKAPVGVQTLGGVDYVALLADADRQAEAALQKRRIVDPTKKSDSLVNVYETLEEALAACRSGDEVVIRYDGLLPVEPVRLDKKNLQELTIRPEENHHPVLRLVAAKDRDPEPALFRVYDGKLKLEGLEFVLQPDEKFGRQSLIDLAGQGQCLLTNCVVTMDRGTQQNTHLAAVTLSDPGKVMMQPARPLDQAPKLTLDGCLVRGDGDLIACQISRPILLVAENTLAVLKGSLLNVEVGAIAPEGAAAPSGQMSLSLKKVTTYLTGNLVRLRSGKDYRSLTPVRVAPIDCLFVAAGREPQPLIHLDDSDLEEKALGKVLFWDGGRTYYGNYATMLDQSPPGEEMSPPAIGPVKWETLWGNSTGKPLKPIHFAAPLPPAADEPFSAAVPVEFHPLDAIESCGADVNRLDQTLPPLGPSVPK